MEQIRKNELCCLEQITDNYFRYSNLKLSFNNADSEHIKQILKTWYINENHNKFPDFFFDGGIIEHFEVTASNETGKGSLHRINDAYYEKENEKYFKQLDKEFIENPHHPGTMRTETVETIHDYFLYEFFVKSFKKNAEHHLESLKKSEYVNQTVIFLIQLISPNLCIYTNNSFNRFYKLSEDKKLLNYIKETFHEVDYIIFKTTDSFEIIDLSKIEQVLAIAKDNLDIRGGREKNTFIKFYIDY